MHGSILIFGPSKLLPQAPVAGRPAEAPQGRDKPITLVWTDHHPSLVRRPGLRPHGARHRDHLVLGQWPQAAAQAMPGFDPGVCPGARGIGYGGCRMGKEVLP